MITPTPAADARSAGARGAGAPARGAAGVLTLADVEAAAHALGGVVARTLLLHEADVDAELGGRLLIKAECHQRTGAFKIRGAYHRMATLSAAERARGALVPCGGGVTAATAVVMQALPPGTRVYAAEPERLDDTRRSLAAGHPVPNPKGRRTICDAFMTPIPNDVTFPINRALLAGAVRFAFERFKIVVESGAAIGLAAVLSGDVHIRGRTSATIVTGGNVDAARFGALLAE